MPLSFFLIHHFSLLPLISILIMSSPCLFHFYSHSHSHFHSHSHWNNKTTTSFLCNKIFSMDFDLENPLTHLHQLHSDDASLFLTESDHMLSPSYLHTLLSSPSDFAVRRDTVSFISQVPIFSFSFFFLSYFPLTLFPLLQCCSNSNIDPHLSYLAVNYLDRFFSSQGVPVIPFIHFFFQFSCFFFFIIWFPSSLLFYRNQSHGS